MNDDMTTSQFLYRAATIYKCENNVFIIPIADQNRAVIGDFGESFEISSITSHISDITRFFSELLTYINSYHFTYENNNYESVQKKLQRAYKM